MSTVLRTKPKFLYKDINRGWIYNAPPDARRAHLFAALPVNLGINQDIAFEEAERRNKVVEQYRAAGLKPDSRRAADDIDGSVGYMIKQYYHSRFFTGLRASTKKDYRRYLESAHDITLKVSSQQVKLANMPINQVTRVHTNAIFADHCANKGDRAALYFVTVFRRVFKLARTQFGHTYLTDNPFAEMEIKTGSAREMVWTTDHMSAFTAMAYKMDMVSIGICLELCFELAQRHTDIRGLRWNQVSFDDAGNALVYIHQTKQGAKIWVSVSPQMSAKLLTLYRDGKAPDGYVCPGKRGGRLEDSYFRSHVRAIRAAAGLPDDLWAADLRRTAITKMRSAGLVPDDGIAVSGHKDEGTFTRVYDQSKVTVARGVQTKRWDHRAKGKAG